MSSQQPAVFVCPFSRLPGETDYFVVSRSDGADGVALSYPVEDDGIPIRCSIYITNYRTVVVPQRGRLISTPHLMLETLEFEKHAMSALQRSAFPQQMTSVTPQQVTPLQQQTSGTSTVSTLPSGGVTSGQSITPGFQSQQATNPIAYTLSLVTKYLWNFKIMFQDERQATTARKIFDVIRPKHLREMPAFEIFKAANESFASAASETNDSAAEESAASGAIQPFFGPDSVNFGWNIFNCEREMLRQISLDPSSPVLPLAESAEPSSSDEKKVAGVGVDLRPWFRTTTMGQDDFMYGKSPTYPMSIIAPNAIPDGILAECVYSRSRGRIPAISFVHLGTGAVLARCSQPLSKSDLRKDGDLCSAMINSGYSVLNAQPRLNRQTSVGATAAASAVSSTVTARTFVPPPSLIDSAPSQPSHHTAPPVTTTSISAGGVISIGKRMGSRTLIVADCRPSTAAYGNQTMGGGFESGPTHDFCKVKFHGIENIHAVTKAFQKLKTVIHNFNGKAPREGFHSQLHDSQWLYHIQRVLQCSQEIAEGLDKGDSYLVHCTDGWDRTSQCTSIAMLLLDPFYRTTVGFCILIEKEFCVFGHKFAERCNHMTQGDTFYHSESGVSASDTESVQTQQTHKLQPSPIFVQWIDAVYQVMRQFPNHFEFTSKLLEWIAEDVYSCLYGTFLVNCDKERVFEGVKLFTTSLWTRILEAIRREKQGDAPIHLLNQYYDAHDAWRFISKKEKCGIQLLPISCSSKRLVFWDEHYLRYDSDNLTIGISDHAKNIQVDAHRRLQPPYFCAELEAYLDNVCDVAKVDRQRDVKYMSELLTRLVVQRPAPRSASQQSSLKSVSVDTKSCWQCHEKFSFFATKEYCSACNTKAPLCSKCIRTSNGRKFCQQCLLMNNMATIEDD